MEKKLRKSPYDRKICGVCAGIGEYLGIDPTIVRLAWAIFAIFAGFGLLAYLLAAVIIPD